MEYVNDLTLNLGIFVAFLILGYTTGTIAEKRHYRSILRREAAFSDLIIVVSKTPPESAEAPKTQLVMGNVVISVDYFKRFIAGLRMLFGGRVHTYESLLDRGRREALLRMQARAKELGAHMIFNVRFETSSVSKGARQKLGSAEVLAYGTAIIP
jgi:uncharacterized protein YbjQ (UPF0145 family)